MAVYREAPKCPHCGEAIMAITKQIDPHNPFIGDDFVMWDYDGHKCPEKHLFTKQDIILHSGDKSDFKIECDALSDESVECIAYKLSQKHKFSTVIGIPKGGIRLEKALQKYKTDDNADLLIVDDVLTTGRSMEEERNKWVITYESRHRNIIGAVIFSRSKSCPHWIYPLFTMNI